jgi:hypothetical protein
MAKNIKPKWENYPAHDYITIFSEFFILREEIRKYM